MSDVVLLIARYQNYIFIALGVLALLLLRTLAVARRYLDRTPFGLEREEALRRQNGALAGLTVLVLLVLAMYLSQQVVVPQLMVPQATAATRVQPTPTPSPVVGPAVIVDSSGCENPQATLTAPAPNERIAGSFAVRGTANIANFAFYKIEISGAGTGGEWLSLDVGTTPIVDAELGRFDASARNPGEYAFRLVVFDNAGNFPPPCVVPVSIVSVQGP